MTWHHAARISARAPNAPSPALPRHPATANVTLSQPDPASRQNPRRKKLSMLNG
jgi:hypothetical protein